MDGYFQKYYFFFLEAAQYLISYFCIIKTEAEFKP